MGLIVGNLVGGLAATVLGLGLSPLPDGQRLEFLARVFDIMVACAYAIGMASLLRSVFRLP